MALRKQDNTPGALAAELAGHKSRHAVAIVEANQRLAEGRASVIERVIQRQEHLSAAIQEFQDEHAAHQGVLDNV